MHVSAKDGVAAIAESQQKGLPVYGESRPLRGGGIVLRISWGKGFEK